MTYQAVAYVVYKAKALMFLGQLFLAGLHSFVRQRCVHSNRNLGRENRKTETDGVTLNQQYGGYSVCPRLSPPWNLNL